MEILIYLDYFEVNSGENTEFSNNWPAIIDLEQLKNWFIISLTKLNKQKCDLNDEKAL